MRAYAKILYSSFALLLAAPAARAGLPFDPENASEGFTFLSAELDVQDLLVDLDRHAHNADWARFSHITDRLFDVQDAGLLEGEDNVLLPLRACVFQRITSLPEASLAGWRLFNDDKARVGLEQVTPSNEREQLERLYLRYFLSSSGAEIADRLASLLFEQGQFQRAEKIWDDVRKRHRHAPEAEAGLIIKRATALARLQRKVELAALLADVPSSLRTQPVTVGGKTSPLADLLETLQPEETKNAATAERPLLPPLPERLEPVWQCHHTSEHLRDRLLATSRSYSIAPESFMIPSVAIDAERVYLNTFGNVMALERSTGRILWWQEEPNEYASRMRSTIVRKLTEGRRNLQVLSDRNSGTSWVIAAGALKKNDTAIGLELLNAETGATVWSTLEMEELKRSVIGQPYPIGDEIYFVERNGSAAALCAIHTQSGKISLHLLLGTYPDTVRMTHKTSIVSAPTITQHGDTLLILMHCGALLQVDLPTQNIVRAWRLRTPVTARVSNPLGSPRSSVLGTDARPALITPYGTFVKEAFASRLYHIDPATAQISWTRPLDPEDTIIWSDSQQLLTLGRSLSSIRLADRSMAWSMRLHCSSGHLQPVFGQHHVYLLDDRALWRVGLRDRSRQRIPLGLPHTSGGHLLFDHEFLFTVTDHNITAYRIAEPPATP